MSDNTLIKLKPSPINNGSQCLLLMLLFEASQNGFAMVLECAQPGEEEPQQGSNSHLLILTGELTTKWSWAPCSGAWHGKRQWHKLKQERFRLDIRKDFFSMRAEGQCSRLLREIVQLPTLEVFQPYLSACLGQEDRLETSKVPPNLN